MIYIDDSVPGQRRLKATMTRDGTVVYLLNGELHEEANDVKNRKAVVLVYELEGIPDDEVGPYAVALNVEGEIRVHRARFKTAAAAQGAAQICAHLLPNNYAAVVYLNNPSALKPKPVESMDDYESGAAWESEHH